MHGKTGKETGPRGKRKNPRPSLITKKARTEVEEKTEVWLKLEREKGTGQNPQKGSLGRLRTRPGPFLSPQKPKLNRKRISLKRKGP